MIINAEFDRFKIDCYVPEINLGFEANGKLFHGFKKKDDKRDKYLFIMHGIRILRIPEKMLNAKQADKVRKKVLEFINASN